MESFPVFFKVRATTYACVVVLACLWLVLLSVEIFTRWNVSDSILRSLMILLVLTNAVTIPVPPILLLLEFRVWLDAARLFLLLVLQIGAATAFTCWNPRVQCPDETPDDTGVCKLLNTYTVMACWIIPVILVLYTVYFAVMVYLQSRIPVVVPPSKGGALGSRSSIMPLMDPEMAERRPSDASGTSSDSSLLKPPVPPSQPPQVPRPLLLPQRQSTLPALSQPPVSVGPQRHRSLPAIHHPTERSFPRRTMTLTIPAPLAPQSQPYVPPLPVSVQPGVAPASHPARPVVRHLSMMPPLRRGGSSERISPLTESPTARSVLSKPMPSYLM
ncbi:hypothetical protein ID866_8954 [Astraeus odoratus]|nr:hypothetical protein ID866_8954 [Astraeus odoratus]